MNNKGLDSRVIKSEDDALELLKSILEKQVDTDNLSVSFEGWPHVHVYLQGKQYDSTITTGNMKGFLELHKSVKRSYALMRYGDSGRRLSQRELEDLDITVKVKEGSSDQEALLEKAVQTFARELVNMDSEHKLIATLGIALVIGGVFALKAFLNYRKEIRLKELDGQSNADNREIRIQELNQMNFMAEQETKRMEMFTRSVAKVPELQDAQDFADDARTELLKGTSGADSVQFQGVDLKPGVVSELRTNAKRKMKSELLSGEFRVSQLNSDHEDVFRVKLKRVSDGLTVSIDVPDVDEPNALELREALFETAKNKGVIKCTLEVKKSGDQISSATISRFTP